MARTIGPSRRAVYSEVYSSLTAVRLPTDVRENDARWKDSPWPLQLIIRHGLSFVRKGPRVRAARKHPCRELPTWETLPDLISERSFLVVARYAVCIKMVEDVEYNFSAIQSCNSTR